MTETDQFDLPPHAFDNQDAGEDLGFYARARMVTHIDEAADTGLVMISSRGLDHRRSGPSSILDFYSLSLIIAVRRPGVRLCCSSTSDGGWRQDFVVR